MFYSRWRAQPIVQVLLALCLASLKTGDCEFAAENLAVNQWTSGSCSPNTWKDYKLELDTDTSKNNLLFQVRDKVTQVRIDGLEMHVVEDSIPVHRETLGRDTGYAIDNIYTRSISYYDLQPKTYYLLLRCKEEAVEFEIRPEIATSILELGTSVQVEICPDDLLHHKIIAHEHTVPEMAGGSEGPHHLKVKVSSDHSDVTVQPAHGHPPLFLVPPYLQVSADSHSGDAAHGPSELNFCDVHLDDIYYIGMFGSGQHCTNYAISLEYFSGGNCSELDSHGLDSASASAQVAASVALEMDHFKHGYTAAHQTTDYFVEVPEGKNCNLEFILEDLSEGMNPTSLTLKLFYNSIPVDRHTEDYTARSSDGLYSIVVNSYDVKAGTYFLSVTAGAVAVRYKVIALDVRSVLHPSLSAVHGEACSGDVLYHYYEMPKDSTGSSPNVEIEIAVHGGTFFYYTAHGHPPLKMIPPYQFGDYEQLHGQSVTFGLCNMEPGKHYVAIKGGDVCANYEISVRELEPTETCHEIQHICNEDCLVHCTEMEAEHMLKDSCDPGETKKYMITVDEAHADSNFEIQVVDRTDRLFPRSLLVQHFKGGFTEDYKSPRYSDIAPNGVFSITVSSWDLRADRHFILVTCNPSSPVDYNILTHLSPAQLVPHSIRFGDVCPGDWFHYHADLDSSGHVISSDDNASGHRRLAASSDDQGLSSNSTTHAAVAHVKFKVWLHIGSLNILTKQSSPPLKLVPPYYSTSAAEQLSAGHAVGTGMLPTEVWHCNATEGTLYLALQGIVECASFEVDTEVYSASDPLPYECGGEMPESLARAGSTATSEDSASLSQTATNLISSLEDLSFGHYTLGSCESGSYTGYHMHVDAAHADKYNLIITAEDLSNPDNPSAISLMLFKDDVPANRYSEHSALTSLGGLYSVAISAWDLAEGHYFVYIQCGDEARDFRILPDIHSKMTLTNNEAVTGTVCPGEIMLHAIDTPLDGSASQLHWDVTMFAGDVYIIMARDHPQLRLIPPYNHLYASDSHTDVKTSTVSTCHVELGMQYITIRGGDVCADYQVRPSFGSRSDCSTLQHQPKANVGDADLTMWHFHYDSCDANGVRDMRLHINDEDGGKNLEIIVQDLDTNKLVTNSLAVYLYEEAIPLTRETEKFTDYSNERMFALGVNSQDLRGGTDYFVSVKCNDAPGRFRVIAMIVNAQLEIGHHLHGEICPQNWMHHYYDTTHLRPGGHSSASSNATSSGDHRRRSLMAGTSAIHLRFTVDVFMGDHYYQMRPSRAPISLAPPFRWADYTASKSYGQFVNGRGQYVSEFCNVQDADVDKIYFTLSGGRNCAVYELGVEEWSGDGCVDMEHDTSIIIGNQADVLTPHHVTTGSCEAGNWKDFSFALTDQDEHKNIAVTVEDLSNSDNPDALTVHLYHNTDKVPSPRIPYIEVTEAKSGIYSMGIDEVHVHAGTYFVSVRCRERFSRYRVALELVDVEIPEHESAGGYIIPGAWTYHFFQAPENMPHFRFETTIFTGHVYLMSTRQDYPPSFVTLATNSFTKILAPVDGAPVSYSVTICNATGQKHYIGMYGGKSVADYITRVVAYSDEESCSVNGLDGYQSMAYQASSAAANRARTIAALIIPAASAIIMLAATSML